jgi:hypothetical protein
MKKLFTALFLFATISTSVKAQTVTIASKGTPVVIDGKLYGEYQEDDNGTLLTIKTYAQVKDGKLTLAKQTNSSYGLRGVEVCTIDIAQMYDVRVPEAAETDSKYKGTVYSAMVFFKDKAYNYNQKDYYGDGKMGSEKNWNYYLFINSDSKENIEALSKAIKQGSFDGITLSSSAASEQVATKKTTATTTATNTNVAKTAKEVSTTIRIEVQNTTKEQVFVKYEGSVKGSSFLGAGTVTSYKVQPGDKILNKKTGAVLVAVPAGTKDGQRFKF